MTYSQSNLPIFPTTSSQAEPSQGDICTGLTKYVVKCHDCGETLGLFASTKRAAEKQIRSHGWRTKKNKWHCPVCYD